MLFVRETCAYDGKCSRYAEDGRHDISMIVSAVRFIAVGPNREAGWIQDADCIAFGRRGEEALAAFQ